MLALIPVKALPLAKSRLAGRLGPSERSGLMRDTLRRTLEALKQSSVVERIVVATRDAEVAAWTREWGAEAMSETRDGLNECLAEIREALLLRDPGLDSLLVLPADLAWPAAEDIAAMAAMAEGASCVVVAPDRRDEGTNALLLKPPGVIDFHFGPGSARAHAAQAEALGIALKWHRSSSISLDVDRPDDLNLYGAAPYVW